jgi:hypothetical protein
LKKILGGILLFVIVFLFSLISNFPMESIVNHVLSKEGKKAGLTFDYDSGTFSLTKVELENVTVLKQGNPFMKFDNVKANIGLGKINIECEKEKGILKADIESEKTRLEFKDFFVVTEGTKFFKRIALTGDLINQSKKKTTTGRLRINLTDPIQTDIPISDIIAVTDIKAGPAGIEVDIVDLQGNNIRGNGKINIETDKRNFDESKINGTLKLRTADMPLTLVVSGTIGNIKAAPQQ